MLETALNQNPSAWDHPGLLHMYIHLMEMSPTPELALPHGDRLATLIPQSGHLVHMATHIDVLCGDYQNTVWRNARAAEVDKKYEAVAGAQNFYTVYRRSDGAHVRSEGVYKGEFSGDIRIDPAPRWNRNSCHTIRLTPNWKAFSL